MYLSALTLNILQISVNAVSHDLIYLSVVERRAKASRKPLRAAASTRIRRPPDRM
jgi:hypothetical protein